MGQVGAPAVFLDTNVLYGGLNSDIFLSLATADKPTFKARWTEYVFQELRDNLYENYVARGKTDREKRTLSESVSRRIEAMRRVGERFFVYDWEPLVPVVAEYVEDPDDTPILAGAVRAEASILVTENTSDFNTALISRYFGIAVRNESDFLNDMFQQRKQWMLDGLSEMLESHNNPPQDFRGLVKRMREIDSLRSFSQTIEAEAVRRYNIAANARLSHRGVQGRDAKGRFTAIQRYDSDIQLDCSEGVDVWTSDGNMY